MQQLTLPLTTPHTAARADLTRVLVLHAMSSLVWPAGSSSALSIPKVAVPLLCVQVRVHNCTGIHIQLYLKRHVGVCVSAIGSTSSCRGKACGHPCSCLELQPTALDELC